MRRLCAVIALALIGFTPYAKGAFDVNGNLSDWGVTVNGEYHLDYAIPYSYTEGSTGGPSGESEWAPGTVFWHAEDSDDGAGSGGYVGPNYGGQNYDAEFLGVAVEKASGGPTTLRIGIATGQRPDNGQDKFGPGDVRIAFSNPGDPSEQVVFGVEIGGGLGVSASASGSITEGDAGTTYQLDGSGHTVGVSASHLGVQAAGTVWLTADSNWLPDPIAPPTATQMLQFTGDTLQGTADYIYTYSSTLGEHAFIEMSVDWSLFDSRDADLTTMCVEWGPACGNDRLSVSIDNAPPPVVPEPSSMVVWGLLGTMAIGWWRRKRAA